MSAHPSEDRSVLGLSDDDFDDERGVAYPLNEECWLAFGRAVLARLAAGNLEMEAEASKRQRALRFSFVDPARYFAHKGAGYTEVGSLHLALETTHASLDVVLRVPSVPRTALDFRNLRARLFDAEGALALASALEALPQPFSFGPAGETRPAVAPIAPETLRRMLDRAEFAGLPLWVGWSIPKELALSHASTLDEQLEDALVVLAELGRLIAFSEDNDFLREPRKLTPREPDVAREPRSKSKRYGDSIPVSRDQPEEAELRTDAQVPPSIRFEAPVRDDAAAALRMLRRPSRVTDVDPNRTIEAGAEVQVLAGPFSGKIGIVQDVDSRGQARVRLGLLATIVPSTDLIGLRQQTKRTGLRSSHRSSGVKVLKPSAQKKSV